MGNPYVRFAGNFPAGPRPPEWPVIIQGGMGVAVSNWRLARAVSLAGHLGVVSGTAIDTVLVRRLQDGDVGGHVRRALAACPWPALAAQILARYFRPDGRAPGQPYARLTLWTMESSAFRQALAMVGGFVEVWLAKVGHSGRVGINLLTKVTLPTLPVLYGALRAGVDVVLMGAGIPRDIPGALDCLAEHQVAAQHCDVVSHDAADASPWVRFDPQRYEAVDFPPLVRPAFFPIIAAHSLATLMARKASGSVQGFVVEGPTAGGHNAPPRGTKRFDEQGQPVYGDRDVVDLDTVAALGYPYWLAGGVGSPAGLRSAQALGAVGIQVGTLFAHCEESGLAPSLKHQVRTAALAEAGVMRVYTDPLASPTGFPFKVVDVADTLSDQRVYGARERICELGYLREAYRDERGRVRFRCASEPVRDYMAKGGRQEDTVNRKCLCSGLLAAAGMPQTQANGKVEPAILTSGDDFEGVRALWLARGGPYSARDAIDYLTQALAIPGAEGVSVRGASHLLATNPVQEQA